LAVVAGLLEVVPYIGPFISAIPALLIALTQSPALALAVVVLYILLHELEGYVLVPKIMQKTVGTSPLAVLIALLVGFKIAGIVGLIISVPLVAAFTVTIHEFWPNKVS
jgi:predicted PurR-regulated permease PerM